MSGRTADMTEAEVLVESRIFTAVGRYLWIAHQLPQPAPS